MKNSYDSYSLPSTTSIPQSTERSERINISKHTGAEVKQFSTMINQILQFSNILYRVSFSLLQNGAHFTICITCVSTQTICLLFNCCCYAIQTRHLILYIGSKIRSKTDMKKEKQSKEKAMSTKGTKFRHVMISL